MGSIKSLERTVEMSKWIIWGIIASSSLAIVLTAFKKEDNPNIGAINYSYVAPTTNLNSDYFNQNLTSGTQISYNPNF